jgi:hypothetical protein
VAPLAASLTSHLDVSFSLESSLASVSFFREFFGLFARNDALADGFRLMHEIFIHFVCFDHSGFHHLTILFQH